MNRWPRAAITVAKRGSSELRHAGEPVALGLEMHREEHRDVVEHAGIAAHSATWA